MKLAFRGGVSIPRCTGTTVPELVNHNPKGCILALDKNRVAEFRSYLDKRSVGRRYYCHPNSTPRRVREGTFPPATIWLGPSSPRWDAAELDRYDALLALTGDLRQATAQVLAERAQRLQGV